MYERTYINEQVTGLCSKETFYVPLFFSLCMRFIKERVFISFLCFHEYAEGDRSYDAADFESLSASVEEGKFYH